MTSVQHEATYKRPLMSKTTNLNENTLLFCRKKRQNRRCTLFTLVKRMFVYSIWLHVPDASDTTCICVKECISNRKPSTLEKVYPTLKQWTRPLYHFHLLSQKISTVWLRCIFIPQAQLL